MTAEAVRATAIARREVRNSLERLQYHLTRGVRGTRGINREVAFLNSLYYQLTRVNAAAVGRVPPARLPANFGTKALQALRSAKSTTVGRMKSSLLADFASDGLRAQRYAISDLPGIGIKGASVWIWQANASACPTCLEEHGKVSSKATFVPLHPSCLCVPVPYPDPSVRRLTDDEIIAMQGKYGDPRYRKKMRQLADGDIVRGDLVNLNAINRSFDGVIAFTNHDAALGNIPFSVSGSPGSAATSAPAPQPQPQPAPPPPTDAKVVKIDEALDPFDDDAAEAIVKALEDFNAQVGERGLADPFQPGVSQGDRLLEEVYRYRGLHGKARLMDVEDWEKLDEGFWGTLWRGVPEQFAKSYTDDALHRGGLGIYGNGTYTARSGDILPSGIFRGQKVAQSYADHGSGAIHGIKWTTKPKVIEYGDAEYAAQLVKDYLKKTGGEFRLTGAAEAVLNEPGKFAAFSGYDALYAPGAEYMVILNRSITATWKNAILSDDLLGLV